MPVGLPEFVENPEPRCPVVLVLDTSGSMGGEPITHLNHGVQLFKDSVSADAQAALRVEVAIVTFGPVQLAQDFVTIYEFIPPQLAAKDTTPMGEAVLYALDLVEKRKQVYRENDMQYYRPWIFLITDGAPNPGSPWREAASRVREAESAQKILFFTVAVEGANTEILKQLAPPQYPPMQLNGLDFKSLFQWLSTSIVRVSSSRVGGQQVELPAVTWGKVTT